MKEKLRRIKTFFKEFAADLVNKDISTYAASISFFLFLSILPILILVSLFLPLTGFGAEELIDIVIAVTPDAIDDLAAQTIREVYARSSGIALLTLIVVIWNAAQSLTALIRGLRMVYEIPGRKNYLKLSLTAVISMFAIAAFLILSVVGIVLLDTVIHTTGADQIQLPVLTTLILHLRHLIMLLLTTLLLTLLYTFISDAEKRPRSHLPGAVVSSVAIMIFTWIFSAFASYNGNYQTIYGNLATIVIMFFWGYACVTLMLIGGSINQFLIKRRALQNHQS